MPSPRPAPEGVGQLGPRAARLVADAVRTTRQAGATGRIVVRADSAYYSHDVIAAARGPFPPSPPAWPSPCAAPIAAIPDNAWTPIRYPNATWDEDEQRWISDAESPKRP